MSRLGKVPVDIPAGVKLVMDQGALKVEGPKGKLSMVLPDGIEVSVEKDRMVAKRLSDASAHKANHGMFRTMVANMVKGVAQGYERRLEIVGVGFRAAVKGKILNLTVGYSHQVDFPIPEGVSVKVDNNTMVTLQSADKQLVGETAAKIRAVRPPEPYQGKGIKYVEEKIRRKAGKAAAGGK
jgi:large subunit ribosomal protein L6